MIRDFTRFLWLEDPRDPNSELIVMRFKVVLFGATCSQFLLNATILKHLTHYEDCEFIRRGLYIDKLQITDEREDSLVLKYWKVQEIFSSAHLYLREWVTNSSSLHDQLVVEALAAQNQSVTKVLGMKWMPNMDELGFQNPLGTFYNEIPTKRQVLSEISKIFDPLGLLLPVTIRCRIIMQELWCRHLNWDDLMPHDLFETYKELLKDIRVGLNITITRQILPSQVLTCDLHAFADASTLAYGVAIYVVFPGGSCLITAKARVAPIKPLTIPKMELTAVLLAARLLNYVCTAYSNEVNFSNIYVWSDSQITLHWVCTTDRTLPIYVRNRVDEVRTLLPEAIFKYVPTIYNPADLITRGMSANDLSHNSLWWHGPSWLPYSDLWPQWTIEPAAVDSIIDRGDQSVVTVSQVSPSVVPFIDWERFSTYEKLLRVVSWMMRFIGNVESKQMGTDLKYSDVIQLEELRRAEQIIIRAVQGEAFPQEVEYLKHCKGKSTALVEQLNLAVDEDQILRC